MGGARGEASLVNTVDADILEYILAKLAARIPAKSRTFLVKVKAHRGEPLIDNWDLRVHLRESTRVQNRRNVQLGSLHRSTINRSLVQTRTVSCITRVSVWLGGLHIGVLGTLL